MSDKKYRIVSRNELDEAAWNAFVDGCTLAWANSRSEYIDSLMTWPALTDVSFAVVNNAGEISAVVACYVSRARFARLVPYNWLWCQGGFALGDALGKRAVAAAQEKILEHLEDLTRQYRALKIDAEVPPLTPILHQPDQSDRPLVNPLLSYNLENTLTQTCIVDLTQSVEDLQKDYRPSTRQEIRKVEDSDVNVRLATPHDLDAYYKLHLDTYQRTGARPHNYEFFEGIFTKMLSAGLVQIMIAHKGEQAVAAQNSAIYKGGALYWTGASRSDAGLGVNRYLLDRQIMKAKENGFTRYEVGEIFLIRNNPKLEGLSHYKRSFGGQLYPYYRGRRWRNRFAKALAVIF